MDKLPDSRVCYAVPGDCVSFRCEEEAVIIFLPVKEFFPQFGELKRIMFDLVKSSDHA